MTKLGILSFFVIASMISSLCIISHPLQAEGERPGVEALVVPNLESILFSTGNGLLDPSYSADPSSPEKKRITADYDDYILVKMNRREVDGGIYGVDNILRTISMGKKVSFKAWLKYADTDNANDEILKWYLKINDQYVEGTTHDENGDQPSCQLDVSDIPPSSSPPKLFSCAASFGSELKIEAGDKISYEFKLELWDDVEFWMNTPQYDSGLLQTSQSLGMTWIDATSKKIVVDYFDAFHSQIILTTLTGEQVQVQSKSSASVQNGMKAYQFMGEFKGEYTFSIGYQNANVSSDNTTLPISYTDIIKSNDKKDNLLPGFEGILAITAMFISILIYTRRKK